jgi:hypothetical protein
MPSGDPTYEPYGAHAAADDTRQAQQRVANDAIADVDCNSILARAQGETIALMGKNFEAGASRRNAIFDDIAHLRASAK